MFKFNHNNYCLYKRLLMKVKMSTSNKCYLCKLSMHTLHHMLVDCSFTQSFWRSFRTGWFIMTKVNLNLCRVSILYGYFRPCKLKTISFLARLILLHFYHPFSYFYFVISKTYYLFFHLLLLLLLLNLIKDIFCSTEPME